MAEQCIQLNGKAVKKIHPVPKVGTKGVLPLLNAVTCLISKSKENQSEALEQGCMYPLIVLIGSGPDSEITKAACTTLKSLLHTSLDSQQDMLQAGGIGQLSAILQGGAHNIACQQAAEALSNAVERNSASQDEARRVGVLGALVELLRAGTCNPVRGLNKLHW